MEKLNCILQPCIEQTCPSRKNSQGSWVTVALNSGFVKSEEVVALDGRGGFVASYHGDYQAADVTEVIYRWRVVNREGVRPCPYQKELPLTIAVPPVSGPSGRTYVGTWAGKIVAFSPDGELVWRFDTCLPVLHEIVLDDQGWPYAVAYLEEEGYVGGVYEQWVRAYIYALEDTDL